MIHHREHVMHAKRARSAVRIIPTEPKCRELRSAQAGVVCVFVYFSHAAHTHTYVYLKCIVRKYVITVWRFTEYIAYIYRRRL